MFKVSSAGLQARHQRLLKTQYNAALLTGRCSKLTVSISAILNMAIKWWCKNWDKN